MVITFKYFDRSVKNSLLLKFHTGGKSAKGVHLLEVALWNNLQVEQLVSSLYTAFE